MTPVALVLFGVVFFWQFPHTVAIGWLYRRQYATGAVKVAAVVDPSGRLAGWLALCGAACLLLVSLVPLALSMADWTYGAMAGALGLAHLALAARFFRSRDDAAARSLWWMTLIHLPALLAALLIVVRLQSQG